MSLRPCDLLSHQLTLFVDQSFRFGCRLEALQHLQGVADAEGQAVAMLKQATEEATSLRSEANTLLQLASAAALEERTAATRRAKEVREQADALLDHATREAGRIVREAHENATKIGGDAYIALRDKEQIEQALIAIRNVVDGCLARCRELLGDEAAELSDEQLDAIRQHAQAMANVLVELFLTGDSRS